MEHAGTIGDGSVRSLYRDEWLSRFDALFARSASPSAASGSRGKWKPGAAAAMSPPPPRWARSRARSARAESTASTARAIIAGFAYFPEALAAHVETLAAPADRRSAPPPRLRDRMVDAVMAGAALDRASINTILETAGAARGLEGRAPHRRNRLFLHPQRHAIQNAPCAT